MMLRRRLSAGLLSSVIISLLVATPAGAHTFRCSISTQDYGDIVATNIDPVSPDVGTASPSGSACIVAGAVAEEAALQIALHHGEYPHAAYPTSLKLTLDHPGDVNAIEIWRYRIQYPVKGRMHGFVVARCEGQMVAFTLVPHPPRVIGS